LSLETYAAADDLYLARGREVNPHRPVFTGDVFANVAIPGVQDSGMAIVIAHPCSMRGPRAQLASTILTAAVYEHGPVGPEAWTRGYFGLMPLPKLRESGMHVGALHELGRARTEDVLETDRIACLSVFGVNLLQQRLIWHLTRLEVPTFQLQEAFSHTYEEADLLEEWTETLSDVDIPGADAVARFEDFIREMQATGRTRQEDLRDPQRRSAVRSTCRAEARRIASQYAER
jgi:hypothetical protein